MDHILNHLTPEEKKALQVFRTHFRVNDITLLQHKPIKKGSTPSSCGLVLYCVYKPTKTDVNIYFIHNTLSGKAIGINFFSEHVDLIINDECSIACNIIYQYLLYRKQRHLYPAYISRTNHRSAVTHFSINFVHHSNKQFQRAMVLDLMEKYPVLNAEIAL